MSPPLLAAALVVMLQGDGGTPLIALAAAGDRARLVAEVRARPGEVREALEEVFAAAVVRPVAAEHLLLDASRIGAAYAAAWSDSFPLQEVGRFRSWTADQRRFRVRADSLRREGNTLFGRDGPAAALAAWRKALAAARSVPDTAGMAAILGNIGVAWQRMDRADSGEVYLEQSRSLAAAIGDKRVLASALASLAWARSEVGDYEAARPLYAEALRLRQRIGDDRGQAASLNDLGLVAMELGDIGASRAHLEAALGLNRAAGREGAAATNLTNLAALAAAAGDLEAADTLYGTALATFRRLQLDVEAADVLRALGALRIRAGRYPAAQEALREALVAYQAADLPADATETRRELAVAAAAMGDLQAALREIQTAQEHVEGQGMSPDVRAGVALARADLAVALNEMSEAEALYAAAAALFDEAGDFRGVAHARQGLGILQLESGDFQAARLTLESVRQAHESAGDLRSAGLTLMWIAAARLGLGDNEAARVLLRRGIAELDAVGDPVAGAALVGELAQLEALAGRAILADSLYAAGLALLGGSSAPDVRWPLLAGRGMAARTAGNRESAVHWLRAAVAEIERVSLTLWRPERRSAYRADKWDVYAQLALTERLAGRAGAAFEVSERLRARETAALMDRAGSSQGASAPDPGARGIALRRRITELTRSLEGTVPRPLLLRGWDTGAGRATVREALARAQAEYAELLLQARERERVPVSEPRVVGWRDVSARLPRETALIEYLVSDSAVLAFVITRDTLAAFSIPASRRELARLVEFARGTLEVRGPTPGPAVPTWRPPLRRLHDLLLAPAEEQGLLEGVTRLVVVPHAELHYLPFAALQDRANRFLVERFAIAYTPSASLWVMLGERRAGASGRDLLALAPRPDALPASRAEVLTAERLGGPTARALLGSRASEAAFLREAGAYRTLHLATFGVLNKHNPLFSFVELAPGGAQDGRLEVHEVLGMGLTAELVVLSACQTALGSGALADVPTGDDWVGFTRAFLHAGASAVLATLWSVADRPTGALMQAFYRARAAGASPTDALAAAQREMIREAGHHPFDWGGMALITGAAPHP